jgi:hypothetical protein
MSQTLLPYEMSIAARELWWIALLIIAFVGISMWRDK